MSRRTLVRLAWTLAVLALVVFGARTFVGDVYRVTSHSMDPTLREGEHVLVLYDHSAPERFDLVVLSRGGQAIVKRVVGLPGETLHIGPTGDLFVDGERLSPSAPRPATVPVFDDSVLPVEQAFAWGGTELDPWTHADGVWELDAREVPAGSAPGLLRLRVPVSDDVLDLHSGEVRRGVLHVGDLVLEAEVLVFEPGGRLRAQLVEQADTFELRIDLAAPERAHAELVRLPGTDEGPLASAVLRYRPGEWMRLRFSNVDDHLRAELGDAVLEASYGANRPHPKDVLGEGLTIGERVAIGGEGCRLQLRRLRVSRDLHYTRRGDFATRTPLRLGPDEIFVLGDNSRQSRDSREWGPVRRDELLGRARWVVWPPASVRRLQATVPPPGQGPGGAP